MKLTKFFKFTFFVFGVILAFSFPQQSSAQSSIIEKALNSRKSIVHIDALRTEHAPSANISGKIIPNTGKILIAKTLPTVNLNKKGAGIIIHSSGFIVTNLHTIKFAERVLVTLHDNSRYWAKVIHISTGDDLALIKIPSPAPLEPIVFADSNRLRVGQKVIHIGSSEILKETISGGKITGLARSRTPHIKDNIFVQMIRVNLDLYQGDSGGPLLDSRGRLIGLIAAKHNKRERTSFAIPSNKIRRLCLDFMK